MTILTATNMAQLIAGSILNYAARPIAETPAPPPGKETRQ